MVVFTATEYEPIPAGRYRARLTEVEVRSSGLGDYVRWVFTIEDGEFRDRTIGGNTSLSFGPRSKARKWAVAILGRTFARGEQLDANQLIGVTTNIMVEIIDRDGGRFNDIILVEPDAPF